MLGKACSAYPTLFSIPILSRTFIALLAIEGFQHIALQHYVVTQLQAWFVHVQADIFRMPLSRAVVWTSSMVLSL